ncbi:hypothetical protein QBC38DRAFT_457184 [Podospora fimiseda]|uniref:Uncharacterized protein n=1 Tax=Podospora fimiseda TaxID=252190 RepID=A0AAN7GV32_9PEZI|nr:hypothetical protein QBC38DRAFT_457184 [Podospora fimiseda]
MPHSPDACDMYKTLAQVGFLPGDAITCQVFPADLFGTPIVFPAVPPILRGHHRSETSPAGVANWLVPQVTATPTDLWLCPGHGVGLRKSESLQGHARGYLVNDPSSGAPGPSLARERAQLIQQALAMPQIRARGWFGREKGEFNYQSTLTNRNGLAQATDASQAIYNTSSPLGTWNRPETKRILNHLDSRPQRFQDWTRTVEQETTEDGRLVEWNKERGREALDLKLEKQVQDSFKAKEEKKLTLGMESVHLDSRSCPVVRDSQRPEQQTED